MHRSIWARAVLAAALLLLPSLALAVPVITGISSFTTSANTGAAIIVTGTGFGNGDDRIWFPGTNNFVNPYAWGAGSVSCTVPATWSGNVQVQTHGAGPLSNGFAHDISFSYSGSYWWSLPVHVKLNQNGAPGNTIGDTQNAVLSAFDTWACASGWSYAYDGTTALTATNQDGNNVLSWNSSGWSNAGTIAVTTWWYIGSQKVEADIAFNSQNYSWATNGSVSAMDIGNIATHEEGHFHWALDLYGADDAAKTMYGYGSNGEVQKRALDEADVEGAEWTYFHAGRANFNQSVTPGGWYAPIVERNTNDSNGGFAPLPGILNGNATTYVNAGMTNSGLDCASPWGTNYLYLDDNLAYYFTWGGYWSAGATYGLWTNWPLTVEGGRHTLREDDDVLGEIQESNEGDNRYDIQYVWSPLVLATDTPIYRNRPPNYGPFGAPNSDGFQYQGDWWGAVAMIPSATNDDYDVRLFNDYANSTTGFASYDAYSGYLGGQTDFVVWNSNSWPGLGHPGYGRTSWAGITNYSAGSGSSMLVEATNRYNNTYLNPGTTYGTSVNSGVVNMAALDILKVHELYLYSGTDYTVRLTNLSGSADLNMSLYTTGTGWYSRGSSVALSQNPGGGTNEQFTYTPGVSGWFGLVVWKNGSADIGLENTYQIDIGPTLTDLDATITPGGFDYPVVPRNDNTAGLNNAHVTATLDGNTSDTYVNVAVQEISPNAFTPAWGIQVDLDVDSPPAVITGGVGSNANTNISYQAVNVGALNIRGGHHSLTNIADPSGAVPELNEFNNVWTGQWVWSPLLTTRATPLVRGVPPSRGPFTYPNEDGFQFNRPSLYAWVVGLAPTFAGDDYDLYVYDDYTNSSTGFTNLRGASAYGGLATDFVVGHYSGTPTTVYPAAVRYAVGGGGNAIAVDQNDAAGRNAATPTAGDEAIFGPIDLAPNRLVDVYEGYLTSGITYHMNLTRNSGTANIKFAVFSSASGSISGRGGASATSVFASPARDTFAFTPSLTGWHPIVVFRANGSDLSDVNYSLEWGPRSTVGVGDNGPSAIAFAGAVPNPIHGNGRLAFTLPTSQHVRLALFDVSGRQVKLLLDGDADAGGTTVSWDGTGDNGARLRTGLYWARLETGGKVLTRRVALLD